MRTGRYDIVLIDIAEAPGFEDLIQSAPSQPLLLPFVYEGTKAEASAAKRRYGAVLKAPARAAQWLETIDSAMELKTKQARNKAKASSPSKVSLLP